MVLRPVLPSLQAAADGSTTGSDAVRSRISGRLSCRLPLFGQGRSGRASTWSRILFSSKVRSLATTVRYTESGMLKITIHDSAAELRIRLEGRLNGPWVNELRQ